MVTNVSDCDYCSESFATEAAYLAHLREEHDDEMGPIDRRRVEEASSGRSFPTGPVALIGIVAVVGAIVAYTVFVAGGSGSAADGEPFDLGSEHYHGTITVTIDGERVDFTQDRYQVRDRAFHFEQNQPGWHAHAKGITFEYAMDTLDIGVTRSSVTYEGTTYRDGDPNTNVTITINGDSVDPSEYVLRPGDQIRIVAESDG